MPSEDASQRQIFGWITGSPRRDDWPDEWKNNPDYAENYGNLFRIDTGDSGDGAGVVWLAATKEALVPGGYVFALGEVVVPDAGIVSLDPRFTKSFTGEAFEAELTQKSYEYLYNTEFNKLLLAKFHDLFPDVVPDPGAERNFLEKIVSYVTNGDNMMVVGGIAIIAILVAFMLGSYLPDSGAREVSVDEHVATEGGEGEPVPEEPAVEMCPYHNEPLINGECPHGCTITRCADCGAIMKDGKCPNGCKEPEICPSCGSDILEDGSCPNGCTIIRCTECGSIMKDGVCPKGCNADPLHFGWAGSTRPEMTVFSLEVVTPEEYAGFSIEVPDSFVVGRSAIDAHESFLELLVLDNAKKQECSRRYVQFNLAEDGEGFNVSMLKNHNFAFVNNHKISREGDTERISEGETIRLNPNFELKLVRRQ